MLCTVQYSAVQCSVYNVTVQLSALCTTARHCHFLTALWESSPLLHFDLATSTPALPPPTLPICTVLYCTVHYTTYTFVHFVLFAVSTKLLSLKICIVTNYLSTLCFISLSQFIMSGAEAGIEWKSFKKIWRRHQRQSRYVSKSIDLRETRPIWRHCGFTALLLYTSSNICLPSHSAQTADYMQMGGASLFVCYILLRLGILFLVSKLKLEGHCAHKYLFHMCFP